MAMSPRTTTMIWRESTSPQSLRSLWLTARIQPPNHSMDLEVRYFSNVHPPPRVNVKARLEKIFSWCDPNLYVIKPRFILGVKCEGQDDMILKFPMAPSDCVYQFKRFQFPVWVSQLLHNSQQESGTEIAKCWTVPGAKRVLWTQTILRVSMTRVGDERKVFVHSKDGRCKNIVHQAALTWLKRTKLENHQLNDTVSFWSLTLHRNSVWSIQMSYLKFTLN